MKFKLYTEHPYGNGYMLEPVTRGEHLHDEESDELMSFVGVSDDGKVIGKVGGKTIEVDVDDDGRDWAKCDGKLVAKWDEEAQEGWVKMPITEGKKGAFGVKIGCVREDDNSFGFEDRLNAQKTESKLKDAGIKFKRTQNFGVFYFHFDSAADLKKAVRLAKRVIDKSEESEW